jgi:NADH dehydrogenase
VLATGARHSYFGHDEWEGAAPGLKSLEDATTIRRRVLLAFEKAEVSESAAERAALLTFVVIGAGPTGVELAGIIAELAQHILPKEFRNIDTRTARVILVEAGPRVLPAFAESLSAYAQAALTRLGVSVQTGEAVTNITDEGVRIGENEIAARTVLWAAGVKASPAAAWLGVEGRPGRACAGRAGSRRARPSRDLRHRRYGQRAQREWHAGAGHRAGGQAAGTLRGRAAARPALR